MREKLNCESSINLFDAVQVPDELGEGLYKCRIIYDRQIQNIEWIPYHPSNIRSLKLVEANEIDYAYKYLDRQGLASLFALRGECDDILIVKDGYLTDSYYCNIACWDGEQWLTPHRPLLAGTCRARLIEEGHIREAEIRPKDLPLFSGFRLMNALLGWSPDNDILDIL